MAEPHAHSQPIETYGLAPHNRNIWPSAHNRNIWPYNSQAAAPPSRLADSFVCFSTPSIPTTIMACQSNLFFQLKTLIFINPTSSYEELFALIQVLLIWYAFHRCSFYFSKKSHSRRNICRRNVCR